MCMCVCVWREAERERERDYMELTHMIIEADKSQNLQVTR
jgi:hypothetical protein